MDQIGTNLLDEPADASTLKPHGPTGRFDRVNGRAFAKRPLPEASETRPTHEWSWRLDRRRWRGPWPRNRVGRHGATSTEDRTSRTDTSRSGGPRARSEPGESSSSGRAGSGHRRGNRVSWANLVDSSRKGVNTNRPGYDGTRCTNCTAFSKTLAIASTLNRARMVARAAPLMVARRPGSCDISTIRSAR